MTGLGIVHFQMLFPVVDQERQADELRHDRAGAGPGFDRFSSPGLLLLFDLVKELVVNVGAFFQ